MWPAFFLILPAVMCFTPPTYNETVWSSFASKVLLNPLPPLVEDPYQNLNFNLTWPDTVCAIVYPYPQDRIVYRLENFESPEAAAKAGAFVTHLHPCGYCSTAKDLSVYMRYPDLTNPVRLCGVKAAISESWGLSCLADIGFSDGCAKIWMLDSKNTKKYCSAICTWDWIWGVPSNVPPDSYNLNPCIECDETKSGPIFKIVSGRTRRNSGLKSSINRAESEIYPLTHYYY